MALSTVLSVNLQATGTLAPELTTLTDSLAFVPSFTLSDGAGAAQANVFVSDTRTVASGASDVYAISGLPNSCGVAQTIIRVKVFIIRSFSTNATTLTVSVASWAGAVTIPAAGMVMYVAPNATGFTPAGTVTVTNSAGASASYDLVVVGASS